MKQSIYNRYQGREFEVTLQAPDMPSLDKMVRDMEGVARENGMGTIKVLSKGSDPDGGYKAIIIAHNWNPLKWVKKKWEERGGGAESRERTARYMRVAKRLHQKEEAKKKAEKEAKERSELKVQIEREELKARLARAKASQRMARKGVFPISGRRMRRLPR